MSIREDQESSAVTLPPTCAPLAGARHISLTTFRETGAAVATTVWFAEAAGVVYVFTQPHAGKVKRLRHSARVTLAPCTAQGAIMGPTLVADAHVLIDPIERRQADAAISRKYGMPFGVFKASLVLRRWLRGKITEHHVYIAITLTA